MTTNNMTKNEKKVLSFLCDNARITDSEIANRMNLSPQGVRKIRLKLQKKQINEYRTVVNYNSVGINVFAIAQIETSDSRILSDYHIIGAFQINEANLSHILILGFQSIDELDAFKIKISNQVKIHKINVVSRKGMLKNSPLELIKFQLK